MNSKSTKKTKQQETYEKITAIKKKNPDLKISEIGKKLGLKTMSAYYEYKRKIEGKEPYRKNKPKRKAPQTIDYVTTTIESPTSDKIVIIIASKDHLKSIIDEVLA